MKKAFCILCLLLAFVCIFAACDEQTPNNGDHTPNIEQNGGGDQSSGDNNGGDGEQTSHTHAYGEWSVTTLASCQAKGEEKRSCACGEAETRDIEKDMENHVAWDTWRVTTPATCQEKGQKMRTCACGAYETDDVEMIAHTYENWRVTTPATFSAEGEETGICACGATATRTISADTTTLFIAGDNKISIKAFRLYLSRLKGSLAMMGENVNSQEYWNQYISLEGQTLKSYYTTSVYTGAKNLAAALYLYDELELELSDEILREVDNYINALVERDAEGSVDRMNSILSAYGADISTLRETAIIEEKVKQLKLYLYGENGGLIGPTTKEEFYRLKYCRGYQMLFANYYHAYACDMDGYMIYYTSDQRIAYDVENGIPTQEIDVNGDIVYRTEDGKIAYDKENGTPTYLYDQFGEPVIRYYTDAEMSERLAELTTIAEECANNPTLFLEYAAKLSDNKDFNTTRAPNGMYFNFDVLSGDAIFKTFAKELVGLEIGESVILNLSDAGYFLVMRAELDAEAWSDPENSTWFRDFDTLLIEWMLEHKIENYEQYILANEVLANTVDITDVAANKYY